MSHAVFVSYASKDQEVADAVCQALEDNGVRCWIAPRDVLPGMEYAAAIIDALNTCQVFLVIFSETSNSSPQVAREVERAISKNRVVLTLRIDDVPLSKSMEYFLSDRHWLDAYGGNISQNFGKLIKAVKALQAVQPQIAMDEDLVQSKVEDIKAAGEKMRRNTLPAKPEAAVKSAGWDKPIRFWRRHWVLVVSGTLVVILLVVFFVPKLWATSSPIIQHTPIPIRTNPITTTLPTITAKQQLPATANVLKPISAFPPDLASLEPILAYVTTTPPDFTDDFSQANKSWDPFQEGITINDGVLRLTMQAGTPTEKIGPSSKYIKAYNFWLEFDFFFEGNIKNATINDGFPSTGDGSGINCDAIIDLSNQRWSVGLSDGSIRKDGNLGESLKGKWSHLLFLYYNTQAVVFLNNNPLGHIEGIRKSTNEIWIIGITDGQAEIWLDNIKFWDLGKKPNGL
jgi:hypothetical protein